MKLPHQEPLVFAKEILAMENDSSKVLCEFKELPSLAVFMEAAAQSSASFAQDSDFKMGYLANASNIELLKPIDELEYLFIIKKILSLNNMTKFSFDVTDLEESVTIASGELTIVME